MGHSRQWGTGGNSVQEVWSTGGIGYMGNGAHDQWGHRGNDYRGYGVQGVWVTWTMGHMGNGIQGYGYRGRGHTRSALLRNIHWLHVTCTP